MSSEQSYYVMCTRDVKKGQFTAEPGKTRFLRVPYLDDPKPTHEIPRDEWFKSVMRSAEWGKDPRFPTRNRGDILFFVHGYNSSQDEIMRRHRRLDTDLKAVGFKGLIVSYDWPSNDKALNYIEDRHDAKKTAMQLVSDGIKAFAALQQPDCSINVHLLCHSTGAYVVREAFDDADDAKTANNSWMVSQIAFIGADVSSGSMSSGNSSTDSLYRHCVRLTNYSNLHDSVLKLSNAKRIGVAPRVGRVGLPNETPDKAVNIDCTDYFAALSSDSDKSLYNEHQAEEIGSFNHSWYIGNTLFTKDLFLTIIGDSDRSQIPTRQVSAAGRLSLRLP